MFITAQLSVERGDRKRDVGTTNGNFRWYRAVGAYLSVFELSDWYRFATPVFWVPMPSRLLFGEQGNRSIPVEGQLIGIEAFHSFEHLPGCGIIGSEFKRFPECRPGGFEVF